MAILFQLLEGFEGYGTAANVVLQWPVGSTPGGTSAAFSSGRLGGSAIDLRQSDGFLTRDLGSSGAWAKFGFAYKRGAPGANTTSIWYLYEGTTAHVSLHVDPSGYVQLRRGGAAGTLLGTSASIAVPNADEWYWIEGRIRISDSISAGDAVVYVNGNEVLSLSAGTDTRNGLTGVCNRISIFSGNHTVWSSFDDLYFELVEGQSDPLYGDCRVDTVYPTSDGHYQDGTPSTGSDRWATVDETTPSASDYSELADVGDRDSYVVGTLPALVDPAVYGVQVQAATLKNDAGSRSAGVSLRASTTDSDAPGAALTTSMRYQSAAWPLNPHTSAAWTQSEAQAAQPGVRVTA